MNQEELLAIIAEAARTNAETLDLSSSGLPSLPPAIGQLTHLTTLILYNNSLTSLPPEIGQLVHLTNLFLDDNHLTALPPEIGKLTDLTTLSLDNNPLAEEEYKTFPQDTGVRFMVKRAFVRRLPPA
jgi:internalin A